MTAMTPFRRRVTSVTGLMCALALAACADNPAGPGNGGPNSPPPLDGLVESMARGSNGSPPPQQPLVGAGQISGTVVAPSQPGAGNDSLNTAPRMVGATVTIYPVINPSPLQLGPEAASVTTGSDGRFTLPEMAAGEYVVTVEPAASQASTYHGQWMRGMIHAESGAHPWWVVLAKR